MQISVGLPVDHVDHAAEFVTGDAIGEMAAAVEAAGLDAVFVTDHPAPDDRWLAGGGHHAQDPLVALAFAAAATSRVSLHTHVYVAAYRNPFLAAKSVSTLQNLSGGRVILGVAAGYLRPEFAALGVDFETRNEALVETVGLMRRLWSEDGVATETPRYRARGVTQLPHPAPIPVWVGGNSTRAMRHAVEVGDGWSPFPNPPAASRATKTPAITNLDDLAARLDAARAHAAEIGRTEPLSVCFAPFQPDDEFGAYADLGVDWLAVGFDGCTSRAEWLDRLGELAARTR
jgi:probable F420-dependent oxidoreductase